jgi:glycosyltransferase involved in cell wall biosynthesis
MSSPVSVVIPTYNGAAFVAETLASVFAQTLPPSEIIVVDDCSTDGTPGIVKRIAQRSIIPIRLIHLRRNNGGPTVPMNVGVSAAQTPLIALLDQDDAMLPNRLQRQTAALLEQPTAGLTCGRVVYIDRNGSLLAKPQERSPRPDREPNKTQIGPSLYCIAGEVAHLALLRRTWLAGGGSNLCFPKKSWVAVHGFEERFRIAWDYHFALKITAHHDLLYDDSPVCFQRQHDNNLSALHALFALEMEVAQWQHYRPMNTRLPSCERQRQLGELSLALGWGHREQRNYLHSAGAYLAHSLYGNPFRAAIGLTKLAAVCGLRMLGVQSAIHPDVVRSSTFVNTENE